MRNFFFKTPFLQNTPGRLLLLWSSYVCSIFVLRPGVVSERYFWPHFFILRLVLTVGKGKGVHLLKPKFVLANLEQFYLYIRWEILLKSDRKLNKLIFSAMNAFISNMSCDDSKYIIRNYEEFCWLKIKTITLKVGQKNNDACTFLKFCY